MNPNDTVQHFVPKEFLDGINVIAHFKQMHVKGMAKGVAADAFDNLSIAVAFQSPPRLTLYTTPRAGRRNPVVEPGSPEPHPGLP